LASAVQSAPLPEIDLLRVPYPLEYSPGACNTIHTCLRIEPFEKVTLITDEATLQVAASLAVELERIGCEWNGFFLEAELEAALEANSPTGAKASRPLAAMPASILEDLESSQVSIFAAQPQPGESASRMEMTEVVNRRRMRHANMAGVTGDIMTQGMVVDFNEVDRLSQSVLERLRAATYLRATTPAGTDIHAQLSPAYRWFKTSGIIHPGRWSNLPGGECFTAPGEVNGVFVVDGVAGGPLDRRYGLLRAQPLTIAIEGNRIARAASANKSLERDFWALTHTDANSDRVGEIAIGTNIGIERLIGNMLQDEKFPGLHLAFGDPFGAQTGAPWKSSTHIDVVALECSIWLGNADGEVQIMRHGQFTLEA
jgi:leucyl aminopeptidase (aminopeptidase T)